MWESDEALWLRLPQLQLRADLRPAEDGPPELLEALAEVVLSQQALVLLFQLLLVQLHGSCGVDKLLELVTELVVLHSDSLSVLPETRRCFLFRVHKHHF